MKPAAITSSTKAMPAAALWPAKAVSMMASLEKKPAVPMIVAGMPMPVSASVPMIIIQ